MPKKTIIVFTKPESDWGNFLEEFFEDTQVELLFIADPKDFGAFEKKSPDLIFTDEKDWPLFLEQKLKAYQQSHPDFRLVLLDTYQSEIHSALKPDLVFPEPPSFVQFQKELMEVLPLKDTVKVLIVDDEAEIGFAVRDYLDHRTNPSFQVRYAENGKRALEAIDAELPHVMILDLKMPVMTGQEVYVEVKKRNLNIAVIVFFDAITGNEITELHESGRPLIVDKGSEESSMPNMMTLIKKMAFFR